MGMTFATLSHSFQQATNGSVKSLGHIHQVLAAALGYQSFAAYKASTEEKPDYDGAEHVVIARDLVQERLKDLGYPPVPTVVDAAIDALTKVFEDEMGVNVHYSAVDLCDSISSEVEQEIENSEEYNSEFAMTNAYGGSFDLSLHAPVTIDTSATEWAVEVSGTSSLEQDPEKVYHGDVIDVSAKAVFAKLGRRVLGEMDVQELGASIQQDEPEDMPEPEPDWLP